VQEDEESDLHLIVGHLQPLVYRVHLKKVKTMTMKILHLINPKLILLH
jgi:hypothetical protein